MSCRSGRWVKSCRVRGNVLFCSLLRPARHPAAVLAPHLLLPAVQATGPPTPLLDTVNFPVHLKNLGINDLKKLTKELRAGACRVRRRPRLGAKCWPRVLPSLGRLVVEYHLLCIKACTPAPMLRCRPDPHCGQDGWTPGLEPRRRGADAGAALCVQHARGQNHLGRGPPGIHPQDAHWAAQPHAHHPAAGRPLRWVPRQPYNPLHHAPGLSTRPPCCWGSSCSCPLCVQASPSALSRHTTLLVLVTAPPPSPLPSAWLWAAT